MNEDGLVSIEFNAMSKTMVFVYEPHAGYLTHELIEYATDTTVTRILIYEGDQHTVTLRKMDDGWIEQMPSSSGSS